MDLTCTRAGPQFCRCTPDQLGTTRLNALVLGPSHGVNVYAGLATPAINPNGIHTLEAPTFTCPYRIGGGPGEHEPACPRQGVGHWKHGELLVPARRQMMPPDDGAGRGLGGCWKQRSPR
jgi:hypothetical protein